MSDRPSPPIPRPSESSISTTTASNLPLVRSDGTLFNLAGGLVQNQMTGQGLWGRDSSLHSVIGRPEILGEYDLRLLREHSWLIGDRVIEMPAEDMTRAGIDLSITDGNSDDKAAVMKKWSELEVDELTCEAEELARQFGQSYMVIRANGNEALDKPLAVNRVKSIESLWVYDRYQLRPDSREWNKIDPEYFELVTTYGGNHLLGKNGQPLSFGQKIHKSRVLRYRGAKLPAYDRNQNDGCDRSVLQRMFNAWKKYETASSSINEAINSFSLFTIAIANLSELIAANKLDEVKALIQEINLSRSLYGTMVLDGAVSKTEFQNRGGLSGVEGLFNSVLVKELTAATGLPHYKIWGEVGKAGLADDGGAESKAYADLIARLQSRKHRKNHRRLLEMIMNAVLGRVPEDWSHGYNSLYTPPQKEQAEIFEINTRSYKNLSEIPGVVAAEEIRQVIGSDQALADAIDLESDPPDSETEDPDDDEELEEGDPAAEALADGIDRPSSTTTDYQADDAMWDEAAIECWGEAREDDESSNRLYFFQGRRTGIIASSAVAARKKLKRGGKRLVKVRSLTTAEKKIARRGEWVRSGKNGEPAGYGGMRGKGPKPRSWHGDENDRPSTLTRDSATGQFVLVSDGNTRILNMKQRNDAFEDVPNYRKADHPRATCSNCLYSRSARPDGTGWINCDEFDFECRRDWLCDAWMISKKNEIYLDSLSTGSSVSWSWSGSTAHGKIVKVYREPIELTIKGSTIKRNGSEDDPAVLIEQEGGDRVLKLQSELRKDGTGEDDRTDAIRLSDLPSMGSRVRYKGRLYTPNRPYRQGDRFTVLATRNGFIKLVSFTAEDVDLTGEWNAHQPQYWANHYHSFGMPDTVESMPESEQAEPTKPIESTDSRSETLRERADAESIAIFGSDTVLGEDEFESEGAIDLLQTLENIFEDEN